MKKSILMAFIVCMTITVRAMVSDVCTIGYCGVNSSTAGLWVQLSPTMGVFPEGTWATSASTDATVVNRILAVLLVAKCLGSPVWVSGTLNNGMFLIDTVCLL